MSQYLHFTLGPVQGFVSQARRTRDFWAGSFLLSWLTAHAMKAVQNAGGTIKMPSVDGDKLLARLGGNSGNGPSVGSLPNNFIAQIADGVDGTIAVNAVQGAWKALADAVWEHDHLEYAGVSRSLWDSQIERFWDMAWVISDSDDAAVLAQRKNWRSYMPPETAGDKCTMMGEWQELSGIYSPADKSERKKQKTFWQIFSESKGLDLRENERLCAIAYVKRRFVHVWESLDGHQGWTLPTSVPSVSYMAAVPWLKLVMDANDEGLMASFHDAAKGLNEDYGEWSTDILKDACGNSRLKQKFSSLDGRLFFESELEKYKYKPLKPKLKALKEKFNVPSPFYAILMMDGDSLGETKKALADAKQDATSLSQALADFTKKVPNLVEEHNGFLIYAGGDDVLAILPLEDAMSCALACRNAYMDIFAGKGLENGTYSISAAIEYAHMKLPLTMILKDAHKLLDDVAKDATGRDAIACRVWKPGGIQQTWAMPWSEAVKDDTFILADLAKKLGENEQEEPAYASKLLYHIRETLDMLQGSSQISNEAIQKMLVADYVSSGLLEGQSNKLEAAESLIKPLLEQCREFKNKQATGKYSADGALLLRFLAHKGVERR